LNRWENITISIILRCPFIQFDKKSREFFNLLLESLFQVLIKYSQIKSLSIIDTSNTQHLWRNFYEDDDDDEIE